MPLFWFMASFAIAAPFRERRREVATDARTAEGLHDLTTLTLNLKSHRKFEEANCEIFDRNFTCNGQITGYLVMK